MALPLKKKRTLPPWMVQLAKSPAKTSKPGELLQVSSYYMY